MIWTTTKWTAMALAGLWLVGCSAAIDDAPAAGESKPGVDASAFQDGKGDFADRAELIDDIALDSTIQGEFDPRVRNYGYSFEAKKGAELRIELSASAGDDARGLDEGEVLDTAMALYQGYDGAGEIGEKIRESDDGEESVAAPAIEFEVEQTGTYFLAFTSYQDTGTGDYELGVSCEGTDFQCQRPDYEKPCEDEELYVRGGTIDEDTTWEACDVKLLETATVAEGAILTVRPGVTVEGNFLRDDGDHYYGNVTLDVEGTLQAAGTNDDPIAFTALKDRGWGGLKLSGEGHTLEHVFVDRAGVGLDLRGTDAAEIRHAVIEGTARLDDETTRGIAGVRADAEAQAEVSHSLVKGYNRGVSTRNNDGLAVRDSVIRDNETGVFLEGESDLSNHEIRSCDDETNVTEYRDPVFEHVDILENDDWGIRIEGDNIFLQVEHSNLVDNGRGGLSLHGVELADESFLNGNNIYGNNGQTDDNSAVQIQSYHRNTVELEENYWGFISDPELEESWSLSCADEGGEISFTGFAPEPIEEAGPRTDELREEVREVSWAERGE